MATEEFVTFPYMLFQILEKEPDVIQWFPHGFAFSILQSKKFIDHLIPKYLSGIYN
jgi:hypothetical protein